MDSTATLVNPGPPTLYFLSSPVLKDAVIYTNPGDPLYLIKSEAGQMKIIDAHRPSRVLAVIHHRELRPDKVSFPGRDASGVIVSTQKWLKKVKLSDGAAAHVMDTEHGSYIWKADSRNRKRIFADYDLDNPVASCYLHHNNAKPILILEYGAEPLRDDIIVGYLVQKRKMMLEDMAIDILVGGPWQQ